MMVDFKIPLHYKIRYCLLIWVCLFFNNVYAGPDTEQLCYTELECPALSNQELMDIRGGFISADGLEINIGIEQLLFINGQLQVIKSLDISNLRHAVDVENKTVAGNGALIQLGGNNIIPQELQLITRAGNLTIIQNSLNNQQIHNITQLNINVEKFAHYQPPSTGYILNHHMINGAQ